MLYCSPIRRYADVMVHRLLQNSESLQDRNIKQYMAELHSIADRCNVMKQASKKAQERSDVVFLSAYLSKHPVYTDGIIIGIGDKSFTVLVNSKYGGNQVRIFIDEMVGIGCSYDKTSKALILTNPTANAFYEFDSIDVKLMSKVKLYLTAKEKVPIDVHVDVVGIIT